MGKYAGLTKRDVAAAYSEDGNRQREDGTLCAEPALPWGSWVPPWADAATAPPSRLWQLVRGAIISDETVFASVFTEATESQRFSTN